MGWKDLEDHLIPTTPARAGKDLDLSKSMAEAIGNVFLIHSEPKQTCLWERGSHAAVLDVKDVVF